MDTGTQWRPIIPGAGMPGSEVAPGNVNPFTLQTAGSGIGASLTTRAGTVTFNVTATGGSSQVIQLAEVSRSGNTGPQAWIRTRRGVVCFTGVYIRDTSGGKILNFGFDFNGGISNGTAQELVVTEYNSQTSFSSAPFADTPIWVAEPVGIRWRNDGTNYYAEICIDGSTWYTVYQQAIASWVPSGGNACGVSLNPYSAVGEIDILAFDVK
jgi:hypothetical protein